MLVEELRNELEQAEVVKNELKNKDLILKDLKTEHENECQILSETHFYTSRTAMHRSLRSRKYTLKVKSEEIFLGFKFSKMQTIFIKEFCPIQISSLR